MEPPPPAVSVLTSLMCVCLSVWTYASNGRSTAALAVSSFALLSLQLLTVPKLKFSQLASSVFGLFYCGEQRSPHSEDVVHVHTNDPSPLRLHQKHANTPAIPTNTEVPQLQLIEGCFSQVTCPASGLSCVSCQRLQSTALWFTAGRCVMSAHALLTV